MLGLFSRLPPQTGRGTWVLVEERHQQFPQTGLRRTSLLRAEKIAVVHQSVFQRKLGTLPVDLMTATERALKAALLIA